jgi:hypothetical protein
MYKIALFFLLFSLYSCDGNTNEIFNVRNNSSEEITIVFHKNILSTDSIQIISEGITKEVANLNFRGGISNPNGPILFDSVTVYTQTDTMITQFNDELNWNTVTEQVSKFPSSYTHTHDLVITDEDF